MKNSKVKRHKLLVIGQTPPPYYGQSMMLARFLSVEHSLLEVYHVRMAFSKNTKSIGKFKVSKVLHLIQVITQVIHLRFKHSIRSIYYIPAGPNKIPIFRDIFILGLIRPFFKNTIFHFRAAGVSEFLDQSNFLFKEIAIWVYRKPNLAIHLSCGNPSDGQYFRAKKVTIISNGLEDSAFGYQPIKRLETSKFNILFVGVLTESKGIIELLKAINIAKEQIQLNCVFLGAWKSDDFRKKVKRYCSSNQLENFVDFKGEVLGDEKWKEYINADVLCFPTYYEAESFGNVILEAMMFQLPVISTKWRGIPNLIDDSETGYLLEIKAHTSISEKLIFLSKNSKVRIQMGKKGRVKYLEKFTLENHLLLMEKNILETID